MMNATTDTPIAVTKPVSCLELMISHIKIKPTKRARNPIPGIIKYTIATTTTIIRDVTKTSPKSLCLAPLTKPNAILRTIVNSSKNIIKDTIYHSIYRGSEKFPDGCNNILVYTFFKK